MNNNIINNNNFIGSTHQDYYKITSNFILNTSNILESHIYNTSNILEEHIYNTSNILDSKASNFTTTTSNLILARYDKLIGEEIKELKTHTYIYNNNDFGEIRFKTSFNYPVNQTLPGTVIDYTGKLLVYHNYNILQPAFTAGYYDVEGEILALKADGINTDAQLTGIEGSIVFIEGQIEDLIIALNLLETQLQQLINTIYYADTYQQFQFLNQTTNYQQATATYAETILGIRSRASSLYQNSIIQGTLTSIGFGLTLAAGAAIGSLLYYQYASNVLISNDNFTDLQKRTLYENNLINQKQTYDEFNEAMSNLSINNGFINCNIQNQQYIKDLKCDNLNLNTGNISGINYINVNNIVADGRIKENNKFLDTTYLTSNHIYNLGYNYTSERQYPSKLYNIIQTEYTATLIGKLVYRSNFYLNNQSISHGSGYYEVYSSSTFDTTTTKDKLFNLNTSETSTSARWGISLYNSGTGNYQGDNSIDNSYFGDWVIIKLPQPIMLTRYRIYQRTDFPTKAPSLWRVYGSNDGITFTQITEANQTTRLTSYTSGYYEKTITGINPLYSYIGFVFSALLSVSGQTDLSFAELQLFGKEIISNNIISNIYCTSNVVKSIVRNEMPDVPKRKMFIVSIPSSSTFFDATSTTTYYKWDLDLRNYTTTQSIVSDPPTGDLLRIFKISFWYVPSYFGSYINGEPYVVSYTVFMSNKNNPIFGRPETAGVNIYAIGFPENTKLSNILPNNLMLLKNYNSNFNYLTIVSRNAPADIYCIIEDQLF